MKKKSRVLIDSFHLAQALTGIRTYTTQLCSGIEELNSEEVEYVIYPNWQWLNRTTLLRGKVNVVKKVLNHILYFFWKQFCLPAIILVKRIDLVVAPDYLLPFLKFGARSVVVIHDTFYWELKRNYNPVWRWYFLKSVQLGLDKRSDVVVTSNYIAGKVKTHITKRYEPSVVYQAPKNLNYVSSDKFDFEEIGLPENSNYFLHVGMFEERKNLRLLIKAFSELIKHEFYTNFYLLLIGSRGVAWFHDDFSKLNELIKEENLEERIIMPGFIADKDLGKIYAKAFAYVFPSKEEGFGIPVIEAMKAKVPVIISNQSALVEVACDAALIFDMDSEEDLLYQMVQMKNDKIREGLVQKGNIRAKEFSRDSFVNQFHLVVRQRLNS